jgi:hypothetical protein
MTRHKSTTPSLQELAIGTAANQMRNNRGKVDSYVRWNRKGLEENDMETAVATPSDVCNLVRKAAAGSHAAIAQS